MGFLANPRMSLDQLHTFLEIVRLKGFSKAALSCFRTQPAVSAQGRQLEQELNASLFDRLGGQTGRTTSGANGIRSATRSSTTTRHTSRSRRTIPRTLNNYQ